MTIIPEDATFIIVCTTLLLTKARTLVLDLKANGIGYFCIINTGYIVKKIRNTLRW